MITAAILAGGTGTRMECTGIPKQFMEIEGEPILIRTIDALMVSNKINNVLIVIHPLWKEHLMNFIASKTWSSVTDIICGGKSRIESIENAVNHLHNKYKNETENIILIHDAVRPFVTVRLLEQLVENVRIHRAVSPAVPAIDTMFCSEKGQVIDSIPRRSSLYHGQTPEAFDVEIIRNCIQSLTDAEREQNTGTAQICTIKGVPVHMIMGDRNNIKITTYEDYVQAKLYYKNMQ